MTPLKYSCVFVLLCFSCATVTASTLSSDAEAEAHNAKVAENRLTTQVLAIVEHFKQEDPVGIPGAPVPEPMVIESIKQSFSMQEVLMKNVSIYGLSKFRIKYSKVDLNSMLATAIVHLDKMHMEGTYFIKNFFTSRTGPFTVDMEDIYTTANLTLGVSLEGKLEVQTIQMDIVSDKKIAVDFQNLGVLAVLQSVLNSASNAIFGAVKPFMLSEAYSKITVKVNEALDNASKDFILPNSISPLDMGIAEARKKVRQMGYDPFHVPPYNQTKGMLNIQVKDTVVTGISSFYRVGNITVTMINNTIIAGFQIGTQKIHGFTRWEGGVGILTRGGQASFTLQHLKVKVTVEQPLDVRNKPKIKTLQMELGNIQVRCDGAGTADYVVEFVVNILPNLLRYQMMAALENPVKSRVQEEMNKYDVEKVLREYLPKFEQLGLKMDFDFKIEL